MTIFDILAETGDTWERRFANHQRQQAKRAKLKGRIADTESRAAEQAHTAAARRSRNDHKLRDLKAELAAQPKT